jgi:hypothetical protein
MVFRALRSYARQARAQLQDLDKRKRGAPKGAEPAWRKLERMMEQKRTSELLSDFDDYDVGDQRPRKS